MALASKFSGFKITVSFLMNIKTISIFWSLFFPNPVLIKRKIYKGFPDLIGGSVKVCNKCQSGRITFGKEVRKNYFWKRSYVSKKEL